MRHDWIFNDTFDTWMKMKAYDKIICTTKAIARKIKTGRHLPATATRGKNQNLRGNRITLSR